MTLLPFLCHSNPLLPAAPLACVPVPLDPVTHLSVALSLSPRLLALSPVSLLLCLCQLNPFSVFLQPCSCHPLFLSRVPLSPQTYYTRTFVPVTSNQPPMTLPPSLSP